MLEKAVFSEYTTLNLAFGIMITKALEEKDHGYARFLANMKKQKKLMEAK